jgi:hypothetical protein
VTPLFCLLVLAGTLAARAVNPTDATPVLSFKLPTFTKEGHRSMLLQGTEAVVSTTRVELIEMNLTLFSGDDRNAVETIILSPVATALLDSDQVRGDSSVRVIRDDIEITGQGWTYDHRTKKVSITRNARVVFNAQMPDILK